MLKLKLKSKSALPKVKPIQNKRKFNKNKLNLIIRSALARIYPFVPEVMSKVLKK